MKKILPIFLLLLSNSVAVSEFSIIGINAEQTRLIVAVATDAALAVNMASFASTGRLVFCPPVDGVPNGTGWRLLESRLEEPHQYVSVIAVLTLNLLKEYPCK